MADLMEEVRSILNGPKPAGPGARPVTEMKDPADEAFDLLKTNTELSKMLQIKVDGVSKALGAAKQQAERLDKMGSGGALAALDLIDAAPKKALQELRSLVDDAIQQIDDIVRAGARGRGSLGYRRESVKRYVSMLDRKLASLSEASAAASSVNPPDNDYSDDLLAAAMNAADYLSSPKQMEPGSTVFIGSRKLVVKGVPKMVSQGFLITLVDPDDENQPGDAYELLLPQDFDPGTDELPAMDAPQMQVEPTAEAVLSRGDRSVKLIAADLRLTEGDYGDHMYDYEDFVPGMDFIKPGDKVKLTTPTVFRVIGRDGNSALLQPDSMDKEMYGTFVAAAQYSSVPVGKDTPNVPTTNLWKPGMDYIPSNRDLPGRGGKDALDTHTQEPRGNLSNPDGHTSLVGTRVLNYNPHTGKFSMATGKMPGDYEMADKIQIVGHDPSLPVAVGESMSVKRFDLVLDEAIGSGIAAKLRHVVESGRAMKVNGVLMDSRVAAVMLQFRESVSESNRERIDAMGVMEMISVSQRMLMKLTEGKTVTSGLPSNVLMKNPAGSYSFVGKVDFRLNYINKDGSELGEGDASKARDIAGSSNPSMAARQAGWKDRLFKTPEDAEAAAKKLGVKFSGRKDESITEADDDDEPSDKPKKIAPHMWVIAKQGSSYLVSIGDPTKTGSKLKFKGDKSAVKQWVDDNVGKTVSANHVIDQSGLKLVSDKHTKFFANKVAKESCSMSDVLGAALSERTYVVVRKKRRPNRPKHEGAEAPDEEIES